MGVMDVQPYAPDPSFQQHYLPNSHSYSYGYAGDEDDHDHGHNHDRSRRRAPKKKGGLIKSWSSGGSDPDAKRKRRVSAYKRFDSRRSVSESVKRGARWFKIRCFRLCYRWW